MVHKFVRKKLFEKMDFQTPIVIIIQWKPWEYKKRYTANCVEVNGENRWKPLLREGPHKQ